MLSRVCAVSRRSAFGAQQRLFGAAAPNPEDEPCFQHEQRLFGEAPLKPGEKREREDWELPVYGAGILSTIILGIGLNFKPETSLKAWAEDQYNKKYPEKTPEIYSSGHSWQ
eukprot:JP448268.1.p1 GENE.JP448268.1~~JP448268.1.p1  ORF type:complete len:120 (+),score=19.39 JP448268.1:26-361(+)